MYLVYRIILMHVQMHRDEMHSVICIIVKISNIEIYLRFET